MIIVRASAGSFLRTQSAAISEVPVSITLAARVTPFDHENSLSSPTKEVDKQQGNKGNFWVMAKNHNLLY